MTERKFHHQQKREAAPSRTPALSPSTVHMFGIEHGASIVPSDAHLAAESMQLMWRGAALLQTPAPSSLADVVAEAMARKRAEEHEAARQQEMARCADVAAAEAAKVAARRGSESRDAAPCDYAQAARFCTESGHVISSPSWMKNS